jgi:hypothetical protein
MLKARLSVCILLMISVSLALPTVSAELEPEDIRIESNGQHFQYGDQIDITIYGENNTTYRFYVEDKGYLLKMHYIPIWCNWSGIGRVSWIVNDTLAPRWHLAYIKLPNVTSNPTIEFKVDYTDEQMLDGFIETSNEMRKTDDEERFWIAIFLGLSVGLLISLGFFIVYKKLKPYNVRLGELIYHDKLDKMVLPWREDTTLERFVRKIVEGVKWGRIRNRMRRKQDKQPYSRNIETDINPPEKALQTLNSNKRYLAKKQKENKSLLASVSVTTKKLDALRGVPLEEMDLKAIAMKKNELLELRQKRAEVGTEINDTKKAIKSQKVLVKTLLKQERKGVFQR